MSEDLNYELDDDALLELSDEELLNMAAPPTANEVEEDYEEETPEDDYDDEEEDEYEEEDSSDSDPFSDEAESDSNFDNDFKYTDNDDYEEEAEEKPSKEESSKATNVDYKAVYEQIFAPFKANGKEIQVRSADEVIQLMQMGANYNKKMAGIKEQLPILKLLERNDLLDQKKLSYAIDLLNGDQAAIAKLLKDSEIDLYDIDEDSADTYVPTTKGVTPQELALAEVIEDLRDTDAYNRTISVATELWDGPSQQFIVENPDILRVINQHISSGIFDTVWEEVERQQVLGKLDNLNSLEAYKVIGDHLNEQGVLGGTNPKKAKRSAKEEQEERARRKKQATQRPKGAAGRKRNKDVINPLSLSDEEFEKLGAEHLM